MDHLMDRGVACGINVDVATHDKYAASFRQSVEFYGLGRSSRRHRLERSHHSGHIIVQSEHIIMQSEHIASFLNLISAQLEETSCGIISIHHFHNVQCGIANILSLLKYNSDVAETAHQLSRTASNYITGHDLISSKVGDISEDDAGRLHAAHEALTGFRCAVEQESAEL